MPDLASLSRRERQIMEIIHHRQQASAGDVRSALADPPSYSAVRTHLRILEDKGWLRHRRDGNRYIYRPAQSTEHTSRTALSGVVKTFFGGSMAQAVAALVDDENERLTDEELHRIEAIIQEAKVSRNQTPNPPKKPLNQ